MHSGTLGARPLRVQITCRLWPQNRIRQAGSGLPLADVEAGGMSRSGVARGLPVMLRGTASGLRCEGCDALHRERLPALDWSARFLGAAARSALQSLRRLREERERAARAHHLAAERGQAANHRDVGAVASLRMGVQ